MAALTLMCLLIAPLICLLRYKGSSIKSGGPIRYRECLMRIQATDVGRNQMRIGRTRYTQYIFFMTWPSSRKLVSMTFLINWFLLGAQVSHQMSGSCYPEASQKSPVISALCLSSFHYSSAWSREFRCGRQMSDSIFGGSLWSSPIFCKRRCVLENHLESQGDQGIHGISHPPSKSKNQGRAEGSCIRRRGEVQE